MEITDKKEEKDSTEYLYGHEGDEYSTKEKAFENYKLVEEDYPENARGEMEITDINEEYMKRRKLKVEKLGRGMTWFDTGTHDALIETASFVQTIEKRQGIQVCCPEEIAYKKGWITKNKLSNLADKYIKTEYGVYLKDLAENRLGEE